MKNREFKVFFIKIAATQKRIWIEHWSLSSSSNILLFSPDLVNSELEPT